MNHSSLTATLLLLQEQETSHVTRQQQERLVLALSSASDYRVVRPLGAGATAAVLCVQCGRGEHPFPEKAYAMKVLLMGAGVDAATVLERHQDEFLRQQLHLPRHPSVVGLHTMFVSTVPDHIFHALNANQQRLLLGIFDEGTPIPTSVPPGIWTAFALFEAMPQTLDRFRRDRKLLPMLEVKEFAILGNQLLEGLVFLEEQGIIHHDLKLDNILLKEDSTVCFTDWGEALCPRSRVLFEEFIAIIVSSALCSVTLL